MEKYSQNNTVENAVVIGLDALSNSLLKEVISRGYMPYLSSIINKKQTIVRDLTCIPPVTIASWPSIMSGVNPGKHGMYTFFRFYFDKEKNKIARETYSTFWLEHPRIHEMMSFYNPKIKTFMMNPIPDYPIIPVKGSEIVTNMFFRTEKPLYTKNLDSRIAKLVEDTQKIVHSYETAPGCTSINKFNEVIEKLLIPLGEELINKEYKLVWINLDFPDHVFHRCKSPLSEWKLDMLSKTFLLIDNFIRVLFENFQLKIIISDHGFMPYNKVVNINDILMTNGYATKSKTPIAVLRPDIDYAQAKVIRLPSKLLDIIRLLRLSKIGKKIFKTLTGKEIQANTYKATVDPLRSKAYYIDMSYGIFFNDDSIISKVEDILSSYNDLIHIYKADEVYLGPYVSRGPGLVVIPKRYVDLGTLELKGVDIEKKVGANHELYGSLIVADGDISLPERPPNNIVTPLIMCRLGIPISNLTDNLSLVEEIMGHKCVTKNYIGNWKVIKRLARRFVKA